MDDMTDYEKLLAGAERLIGMGGLQEALELLQKMKHIFPDREIEIELEVLKLMYQQERYEETLDEALRYIPNDDGRILQWMMEMYYDPFRDESENMYQHNMECLEQYEYFYADEDKNSIRALLYDGCEKIIFCGEQTIRRYDSIPEIEIKNEEIVLIENMLNIEYLAAAIHETRYVGEIPNYEVPVYLYYDEDIFYALAQCVDMSGLLKDYRAVILVGEDQLKRFFSESQVRIPGRMVGNDIGWIKKIIDEQLEKRDQQMHFNKIQLEEYYWEATEEIDERIRQRKPRILFYTSYFTTVLQYHTRDMKRSAEKMGLETELLIEKGAIYGKYSYDYYAAINSFRPDIIFCIDHFRFEFDEIPENIVWICWVQDPLSYIMDKRTPEKIGIRDFILNHFITWQEFQDVGYPLRHLIDAPIPSNQDIYKPYQLTAKELDQYSCDICFVCHASDVDEHIMEVVKNVPEELWEMIASVYKGYQSYVYKTGNIFYQKEIFREYIRGALSQHFGVRLSDGALEYVTEDMYLWFNQRVFREALVDWILDAGFRNMKLWGKGWRTNPKYEPYAMGSAQNGETLSKIYQASKIVIGNNIMTTAAARAWETMLSGGFYLSNYIPEEADVTDIRKIIEVNEDVIMFYNKDDLIEKLYYYLEHEEERQIMIEKGRKVALEKMTFDSLLKKTLNEVATRLQREELNQ